MLDMLPPYLTPGRHRSVQVGHGLLDVIGQTRPGRYPVQEPAVGSHGERVE